jgi:hypothetical protein
MHVPVELGNAEGKRVGTVEGGDAGSAIQAKPDLVAACVPRPVPDHVDRVRLLNRQAGLLALRVRRGRSGRAAYVGPCAEFAGAGIVDYAVPDAVIKVASGNRGRGGLVELG